MKENQNNYIYIVLVKALTGLGKFARLTGKYEYTHIAVCLDEKFDKFYTFSRRKHHSPFDCGFMIETLDCYAFGKYKNVKLKIFKVPVVKENKEKIEKYIENVSKDSEYIFNFFSMITMPIFGGFKIYKAHNCMSFVSKIIELSDIVNMIKPYYRYNIKQIDNLLTEYLYKEDFFDRKEIQTNEYMNHVCLIKNILYFMNLNGKLIYRLIVKGIEKNER
ncbi:MAG: hypothetical protein E7313_07755 [Clostridiales bacterium]|nr:hypothetical protein [Clostridiales bacterium]